MDSGKPKGMENADGLLKKSAVVASMVVVAVAAIFSAHFVLFSYMYDMRVDKEVKAAEESLRTKKNQLGERFLQETKRMSGLPAVIADEFMAANVLRAFDYDKAYASREEKTAVWSADFKLSALSRHFATIAKEISFSAVWLMNADGDCVAASNMGEEGTFVGFNYADREYFKKGISGERGSQYAWGRQSNKPGLYFSAPVYDEGKAIGVVAVKLSMERFERFVENDEVYISDENGIILAAHDSDMVMKSVRPVRQGDYAKKNFLAQYNRDDFVQLNISPAGLKRYPKLKTVEGKDGYYLFSSKFACNCGFTFNSYERLLHLDEIRSDIKLFSLSIVLGAFAVLALLISSVVYIRRMKNHNKILKDNELKLTELNRELDCQIRRVEQADAAKSDFLANMSHEIRTPLNGVVATADLLYDTDLSDRQKQYVDIMRNSGELLMVVINDILDLSKIEAGRIELKPEPVAIRLEAEILLKLFQGMAAAKKLLLDVKVDDAVPQRLVADPYRLRQVVSNLISNAIKYTDVGGVNVRFSVVDKDGKLLRVSVVDTGRGISPEFKKLVFEKFTQAKRNAISGTGLGLSICRALIGMMNGKIDVDSDGVSGSDFWLEIPLVEAPAVEEEQDFHVNMAFVRAKHVGCRTLLVEDIEMNRTVVSEMLRTLGCIVDTAENGKQALDLMNERTYDIVLMDCNMPVMNGYEATKAIRASGNKIPVIALSAHAFQSEIDNYHAAGMNDFVTKPIKCDVLAKILDKWNSSSMRVETQAEVSPVPDSGASIFDVSILDEWQKSMPDKMDKFIDLTFKDSKRLYGEIYDAMQALNASELAESAHALKSVAGQIGGVELSELCRELQDAGTKGSLEEAKALMEKLQPAYKRFLEAIGR